MALKTFDTQGSFAISAELLTPENFASFGGVMSADHQIQSVQLSAANYGTAVKIHNVAPIANNSDQCPSGKKAESRWNIFRCSAPNHLIQVKNASTDSYRAKVLERHPFSTQTFVPMGHNASRLSYLVIVAKSDELSAEKLPDPTSLRAFVCMGNQSVTYGAGVWHAPMVVIDDSTPHIDFAVFINENGVPDEDCQECYFDPGYLIEYPTDKKAKL
ncbi:hypothetical protein METBIDRAFT_36932 [Metschnikowia bicuspidata var. bicuspidata NRRL YB-4993]|uniref:Ureidoglycolate lyase n=1 Tax=Metschnikowia bicuspidata var. bicuspidata NRRL YB-4993 TaxID=869754 RepID=A0A1A0HH94_9ASCO|nr:hypothetical protein METBIDRAFT_36932 [Metschnikowia bicuspidata var. bicuspidata NRRL YB-4993]OBA23370.1 hypothetical protein METBIDRAFT_36932 [Metschnikowia bicuspidata var. bicuspidata NRRL YB-4993]